MVAIKADNAQSDMPVLETTPVGHGDAHRIGDVEQAFTRPELLHETAAEAAAGGQQECGVIRQLSMIPIPLRRAFARLYEPADEETSWDRQQEPIPEKSKHLQHGPLLDCWGINRARRKECQCPSSRKMSG